MHESEPTDGSGVSSGGRNAPDGTPVYPTDRSHLLRRSRPFPFQVPQENGRVRIRRERRVFASFRGIPSLARGNRGNGATH